MSYVLNFPNQQPMVDGYFDSVAPQWKELYRENGLKPEIFAHRQSVALNLLVESLEPKDSEVLDVGCGAGPASIALAMLGARVSAIDTVLRMVNLTRQGAKEAGVSHLVEAGIGDVHSLRFADKTFDAVVAIGVVYWLHSPARALRELFRVLRPGGHLVISADNALRLTYALDPGHLSAVLALRHCVGNVLRWTGCRRAAASIPVNKYSLQQFDDLIANSGLQKLKSLTVGFGPFSLFECKLIPDFVGLRLHRYLQHRAEHNHEGLAGRGNHYVVLARKPL